MNLIEPRVYSEYEYLQIHALELWEILLDIHNAVLYGFAHNRLAEPGKPINVTEAEEHILNIQHEWDQEARVRDLDHEWTGAPPLTSLPDNAKQYLHSRIREV